MKNAIGSTQLTMNETSGSCFVGISALKVMLLLLLSCSSSLCPVVRPDTCAVKLRRADIAPGREDYLAVLRVIGDLRHLSVVNHAEKLVV